MKQFEIENIKSFTGSLFAGEKFDNFCVTEASFSTLTTTTIDGHINKDFLPEDQPLTENSDTAVRWKLIRPLCFDLVKGNRVPTRFKIVFMMPRAGVRKIIESENINMSEENVNGLFMNVRFEAGKLSVITGVSLREFSLDKSLEEAWDLRISKFLAQHV